MNKISYKNIELDMDSIKCFIDGAYVKLTKTEFLLVKLFINNVNKILSRKDILNSLESKASLRTVDATVSRLKKKLGISGNFIKTRFGFGYGIIESNFNK